MYFWWLLKKTEAYGIHGNISNWTRDFLQNRKQLWYLAKNNPHGRMWHQAYFRAASCMGSILCIIFINDMPKALDSIMKLFVDDAKMFKAIESMDDISIIQNDINTLFDWLNKWQLPLNKSKCKHIHFGKNNPNHDYMMGDIPLESVSEEKYVGVVLDPTLNFRLHINIMISKADSWRGPSRR